MKSSGNNIFLPKVNSINSSEIIISGSKSETNRLLILQALFPELILENSSDSDDSHILTNALASGSTVIDVHHAGTAMRFLTAYFASMPNCEVILTGSDRMRQRPVGALVDALRQLGANITYTSVEGFPPLKIMGQELNGGTITIQSDISSQFITALLLVAPKMRDGITLGLSGKVTSRPYIKMTLNLLRSIGIECAWNEKNITVSHVPEIHPQKIIVESDWSSASYFYSIVALSKPGTFLRLGTFHKDSRQGDSVVADIYSKMGVDTTHEENRILITRSDRTVQTICLDLNDTPDLAQTIAVTCAGLAVDCCLTGLQTLRIKETDRIEALNAELQKLGITAETSDNSLSFKSVTTLNDNCTIETYNDHRMAMAFAPLTLRVSLTIHHPDVVTKSYPDFWTDLSSIGITYLED